jgi:Fur family ferric uptake transcriptional regulator
MAADTAEWADHALLELRGAGFRSGGARRAVVELLGRQDCCLSAQEIFDALRGGGRPVGIASVYRVLEVLSELGLVQRLDVGGGVTRYEPALPNGDHHHHLICDHCGRVRAFTDEALERALARLGSRIGHEVGGHDVVLRGTCSDCSRGGKPSAPHRPPTAAVGVRSRPTDQVA